MRKRYQINLSSFGKLVLHVGVFCAYTPVGRIREKCFNLELCVVIALFESA